MGPDRILAGTEEIIWPWKITVIYRPCLEVSSEVSGSYLLPVMENFRCCRMYYFLAIRRQ